MTMSNLMAKLASLSQAEEFFEVLDVPYERAVLNVNRLHILKRFNQYLRTSAGLEELNEYEERFMCRELLIRAYDLAGEKSGGQSCIAWSASSRYRTAARSGCIR